MNNDDDFYFHFRFSIFSFLFSILKIIISSSIHHQSYHHQFIINHQSSIINHLIFILGINIKTLFTLDCLTI